MDANQYQRDAMRTRNAEAGVRDALALGGLGLAGEAGEVADHIKKTLYHDHVLDPDKVIEELGDVLWYIALLADLLDTPLSVVMGRNVAKLRARYPEGFDPERSRNR